MYNNSMFIFTPKNPIRRVCQRLVGPGRGSERFDGVEPNKYAWYAFSAFIYASIVAMVVIACITTPLYQKQYFESGHRFSLGNWFVWTDVAFAFIFTVEAVIKVIADGFFWTPNAYFRSSWGIIDAVVLITFPLNGEDQKVDMSAVNGKVFEISDLFFRFALDAATDFLLGSNVKSLT